MLGSATEIIDTMEPPIENQGDRCLPPARGVAQLSGALLIAVAAIAAWAVNPGRDGPLGDVTLLYVGAEDCAPCRSWRNGAGADFFASQEFARITYREVRSPHLEDVLKDENWPQDLRDYRSRIKRSDGVPLWLVISNRAVVEQQFGATAWQERILPKLRSYLR
jgi:hypothetical protein